MRFLFRFTLFCCAPVALWQAGPLDRAGRGARVEPAAPLERVEQVAQAEAARAAQEAEPAERVRVLVAYYSETGHTESLAKALAEGMASVAGVDVLVRSVDDVREQEIRDADGMLVGTPVHWGSLSARVKDFLDRVGRVLDPQSHGEGRTGGAFCTGGAPAAGKELARLSILAAFMNLRFITVGGLAADGFGNLGAEATTGPADPGLSELELEEARRSGERFARITRAIQQAR